ncbi:hypothetical protein H0A61_02072 [Koleobacter methoxysyntrophicus]|uniref:SGNH hydrolase-type esterase domain-containing protein n=1 Tax=Koleobacter methoxysyntrophicus TaxID=2751313 RepID=A0A8A0RN56_9FIRM|nr:SGNH/GDSL hydrolase family protein [Koleobacter methoxysyntrophicus]QSQ09693.1 hypothetical protein H0A61_02072 [Koleobacter methoxysyntrophicus]
MIACFGDSITAGRPGVSYLRYLKGNKDYRNFGLGGDTLLGLSKRIGCFLMKSSCKEFIIEIGANDILLPFLSKYSKAWNKTVDRIIARGSIPLSKVADFIEEYEKLICKLSDKQIKVISIPCIGENIESDLNAKVNEYNESIRNLCIKYGVAFVDFNKWQKEIINNSNPGTGYFISKDPFDVMIDSLTTTYLGFSSWISKKRKLILTVDGIHLNKNGAKGLARLIEENVKSKNNGSYLSALCKR